MSRQPNATEPSPNPPATPGALCQAGFTHFQEGRPLDAQLCCLQALAIEADHADTLHLMGLLSLQGGQFDHAVQWLTRAVQKDPATDYLSALGITLKQMGRLEEALKVFDKAVQLKPGDAELWKHLAGSLLALDRSAEALLSYQHALHLDGGHFEAAYQSAIILERMERLDEALAQLDRCVELRSEHVPNLRLRARVLRSLKRYEDYLVDTMRAHALDPADPFACNNVGDALQFLGRYEEGLAWFEKALALLPNSAGILRNMGFAFRRLHRHDEATAAYQQATALDPGNAEIAYDLSDMLLVTGHLAAGWAAREIRWKMPDFVERNAEFSQPEWFGRESVEGKTILVFADEGLGDTIQFVRFVPILAARGARIVLAVQDPLVPLLSGVSGVLNCVPVTSRPLPAFDLGCPVMSLPLACDARLETIPRENYLPSLPAERVDAWRHRLGSHDRLRIGLVWSGNPNFGNDNNRSMPLRMLAPLFDLDATFVSLQKDPRPADAALLRERSDVLDLTADLTDFVDTAALVSCLDVVISVDTGVAHLSATLGRPTWILLPYVNDWRWLVDRDDSPWYSTARLFRQDSSRDYATVVGRVRHELAGMIAAFTPPFESASQ